MARPSKFSPEMIEQAYKLCLLGATDKELADFFDVKEQTINNWKKTKPEFFESLKKGKMEADAKVAESLFNRACGYSHPDQQVYLYKGEPIIVPVTKHYPPDTGAAFIWLKNRQPDKWKDKPETHSDPDPITINFVHPNADS